MKSPDLPTHPLLFRLMLPIVAISIALISFVPQLFVALSWLNYLPLLLLISFFFTRLPVAASTETAATANWWFKVGLLQLSLLVIFCGYRQGLLCILFPAGIEPRVVASDGLPGMMPWSYLTLVSIMMHAAAKRHQLPLTLASIGRLLPRHGVTISLIVSTSLRLLTHTFFCLTLIVSLLALIDRGFTYLGHPLVFGLNIENILVLLLTMMCFSQFKRYPLASRIRQRDNLGRITSLMLLMIAAPIILIHAVLSGSSVPQPLLAFLQQTKIWPFWPVHAERMIYPLILWCWWISSARVVGGIVAELAMARSSWQLLLTFVPGLILAAVQRPYADFIPGISLHSTLWIGIGFSLSLWFLFADPKLSWHLLNTEIDGSERLLRPRPGMLRNLIYFSHAMGLCCLIGGWFIAMLASMAFNAFGFILLLTLAWQLTHFSTSESPP